MPTTRVQARIGIETGYYVRVMRGGVATNVPIEGLRENEIRAWVGGLGPEERERWLLALVTWIGANIEREDG